MKRSEYWLNLLFPRKCPICAELLQPNEAAALCPSCRERYRQESALSCPACRHVSDQCTCIPALMREANVPLLHVGLYIPRNSPTVSHLIYALKEQREDTAARICARMLSAVILRHLAHDSMDPKQWIICYLPRTEERRLTTGFDQSRRLAQFCASYTGTHFETVFRRTGGSVQKAMSAKERVKNAAALSIPHPRSLRGKNIILLDDLVTTGASMMRGYSLLQEAGAASILPACVLKTPFSVKSHTEPAVPWFVE